MKNFNPYQNVSTMLFPAEKNINNLQDVLDWLNSSECTLAFYTRRDYIRAVQHCARLLDQEPSNIIADRRAVLRNFPIKNYNPTWATNVEAARRFLNYLGCAINKANRAKEKKWIFRSRDDSWAKLIIGLEEYFRNSDKPNSYKKKMVGVLALADVARELNIDFKDLNKHENWLKILNAADTSGQRGSINKTGRFLALLQTKGVCELKKLLICDPFQFPKDHSKSVTGAIPIKTLIELQYFVDIASRGIWSITDEKNVNNLEAGPFEKSAKKVLATLQTTKTVDLSSLQSVVQAFDKKYLVSCVRVWRDWYNSNDPRAIKVSTARGYLERLSVLLLKNGECPEDVKMILKSDTWLNSKTPNGSKMPQHIRNFCRNVVKNLSDRLRLMTLHISMRKKAQFYLNGIEAIDDTLRTIRGGAISDALLIKRKNFEVRARKYGACAAFAAIETGACPIRIGNACATTYKGESPWLDLGFDDKSDGHLSIPGRFVKNKKDIDAPILGSDKLRSLSTLRWYEKKIRPLFKLNAKSVHFFPSLKKANEQIPYSTLKGWWDDIIAEFDFPGMNPHMFRHAQASILVAKRPGDWTLISVRLGDHESTCQKFYAWINEEGLMLEAQDILTEEFPNAA